MRTKNIKRLFTFKFSIFLLFMNFLFSPGFTQNNPVDYTDYEIKIGFDIYVDFLVISEYFAYKAGIIKERTFKEALDDIKNNWTEIIRMKLLPDYFKNINLTQGDPRRLPSCVIEAMNELLSNKKIEFTFSIFTPLNLHMFTSPNESTGAVKLWGPSGEYKKKLDNIIIYGLYQEMYYKTKEDWEADREKQEKGYCTASALFHEMMHQALHHASQDKDLKEKFCFKIESTDEIVCIDTNVGFTSIYTVKHCTNRDNMGSDEAIVEDCELKVLPCGSAHYKEIYNKYGAIHYKKNGARRFNPHDKNNPSATDDCSQELCKEGNEDCDDNCTKKEDCPQKPPDHQDDNFSFSTGSEVSEYKLAPEALIYKGGFYHEAVNLFGGLLWDGENSAEELLKISRTLICPSGSMYSHEHDSTLKNILEEYVRRGGSVIVLCQQYGSNYSVIPKNAEEPLKAYGWRESQSCTWGSLYFQKENMHPALSALTGEKASSAVDGYVSVYPSDSTILLRRMANSEPGLLYYPYCNGFVWISAQYPDWGSAHSQASTSELRLFRDLVTFAKSPGPIPMFNLDTNPPGINLNVLVENKSDTPAAKVKLTALTPDRNTVLYETVQPVSLNPGETIDIPISFTLPELQSKDYGIGHVFFELYDADNNLIQMPVESDSGRFSVYKVLTDYTPDKEIDCWLTVENERVLLNDPVNFTLHVRNYTDSAKTIPFQCEWLHNGVHPLTTLTVPANETIQYSFIKNVEGTILWVYYGTNKTISKGLELILPKTQSRYTLNHFWGIKVGQPISYNLNAYNAAEKAFTGQVRFKLLDENYNELYTIFDTSHHFQPHETFTHSGLYSPPSLPPFQSYFSTQLLRLRLEVGRPDGSVETHTGNMVYLKSDIYGTGPSIPTLPGLYEYVGKGHVYPVNFSITNSAGGFADRAELRFDVDDAKITFVFKDQSGEEAGRKEISGINIPFGETRDFNDTITFTPTKKGDHYLYAYYVDETGVQIPFKSKSRYRYTYYGYVYYENMKYRYHDTVDIQLVLGGIGKYTVNFSAPEAGLSEERQVEIDGSPIYKLEFFQVPIGIGSSHTFNLEVVGDNGFHRTYNRQIPIIPLRFIHTFSFNKDKYREGEIAGLNVKIREVSGYTRPLTAQLRVYSQDCNFDNTRTVTITPGIENSFPFQIQLPEDILKSLVQVKLELKIDDRMMLQKTGDIFIPDAALQFDEPLSQINAGDEIRLNFHNIGGKKGNFEIGFSLRDEKGKFICQYSDTLLFNADENKEIRVQVPENAKSGTYISHTRAADISRYAKHTVVGLSAGLNSFTLKEKYFDTETVSGKSEVTPGTGTIENSTLKAEIIRYLAQEGVSVIEPGEFALFNRIKGGMGRDGKLYLFTDTRLFAYDPVSKNTDLLLEVSGSGVSCAAVCFDAEARLWLATNQGLFRQPQNGSWTQWTTADGLISNYINDIIEYEYPDGKRSIWIATYDGISEYKYNENTWVTYTTAEGLPSNSVYKFALEGAGDLWISTYNGLVKYDGTSFSGVDAPFGTDPVYYKLSGSSDGSVWMATSYYLYRYNSGTWDQWRQTDIAYGLYVAEIGADDSSVWIRGSDILVKYEAGNFTVYRGSSEQKIESVKAIISFAGPGVYFSYDPYQKSGFLFYDENTSTWESGYIEKDMDRFLGNPTCLAFDESGRLWVGTAHGISCYIGSGSGWNNYLEVPEGGLLGYVYGIQSAPEDTVFAYTDAGILKIKNAGSEINLIPRAPDSSGIYESFGVDNLSRVWVSYYTAEPTILSYYDGEWQYYDMNVYDITVSDGSGGVWLADSYGPFLHHITSDLNSEYYSSSNSNLPEGECLSLYVNNTGVLWVVVIDSSGKNRLVSFNGTQWIDYSSLPGYPDGILAVSEDNANDLLLLCRNETSGGGGGGEEGENGSQSPTNASIYRFKDDAFSLYKDGFNVASTTFVHMNGIIYCFGDLENEYIGNLLKVSGDSGVQEKNVWSAAFPVNTGSGAGLTIDLVPGMALSAGMYSLKTSLLSSTEQQLASSCYPFVVRGTDISVTLIGEPTGSRFVKAGIDLPLTVESFNNTIENKDNLSLTVKKISPSGVETEVINRILSLSPGAIDTDELSFNESETGPWKVLAVIKEGSTILSDAEWVKEVTQPSVSMEIISPPYAGDGPLDIRVKLANEGDIDAALNIRAEADDSGEVKIEETAALEPGEEDVLSFTDTITTDKGYSITISGDVEKSKTIEVKYGYVEHFNINVLPIYREGGVIIGFDLFNSGGLPFNDTVHFELRAVGGAEPLVKVDKSYILYPGEQPIADTLNFELAPGNYLLKYRTDKTPETEVLFAVQPSGLGSLLVTNEEKYIPGMVEIPITLTNTDSVIGNISININVTGPGSTPLISETRNYYLEPQQLIEEYLAVQLAEKGDYTLTITGNKLVAPIIRQFRVLDVEAVSANIQIGALETHRIPVTVTLDNSGYRDFTGKLVMVTDDIVTEQSVIVNSENQYTNTFGLDTSALTPGQHQVRVYLSHSSGEILSEETKQFIISSPDINMIEVPENLEIDAGSHEAIALKLKNEGNVRGECVLKMTAFDTLRAQREIELDPGEEMVIDDVYIDVPGDLPTGNYPFNYSLSGSGVENGTTTGNFTFKVNGVSLNVDASFEQTLYNAGETAVLTLDISSQQQSDAPLQAIVNWGEFSETQSFDLSSGSASLVFNIFLDEARNEKVFYGIYHEGGKGIHLNDIYLYFRDQISVEIDRQVYAPGEIVHAIFMSEQSGTLTAEAFGESYTLNISSSVSADFLVPDNTPGGTYGISWSFVPTDTTQAELSGSHSFDVSGLVVKVAKSKLEHGKYTPGEVIKAAYTFESNRDETLSLRCWSVPPSGGWELLGESSVAVSGERQVNAFSSYNFNTTQAGTHNLVYGLYKEARLVVCGSMAFDVGDAILMGITTDQFEYKQGNEPVNVKIDYFGEGTAQMELFLDEEKRDERSVTLNGAGSTVISLNSSSIDGGSHSVKVVLTKDGLTSVKTTGFIYGSNLPDLVVALTKTENEGLNYTYTIEVSNLGKTAAAATSLVFNDNGINAGTVNIPALPPDQSHEVIFNWNGTGKAGSHELWFAADSSDTIKEFSEINNSLEITLEVPVLFYTLETDPVNRLIYPANTPINIVTRLINNQENPAQLTLDLSIINDETGVMIHHRIKEEQTPGFASKTINDTFNTGVYPAGNYTLSQSVILPSATRGTLFEKTVPLDPPQKLLIEDGSDSFNMVRELFLFFEPTKIISGTLQAQPQQIPAKTPTEVQLTMILKNAGNVPLEDEILQIDVFNKDLGEVVMSEDLTVYIPLAEEITETKTMMLNLVEGNYEIWLKHNEEIIGLADLVAVSSIKPSTTVAVHPRVLIMNLHLFGSYHHQVDFLTGLLKSQGIEYEIGQRLLDSYVKFHKGQANVNIVFGNAIGRNLRDELKERVWHGEGLILFCDKPARNPDWKEFPGVTIQPIPGKTRETVIQILPNELCSEGEIECTGKLKLQMIKEQEDVVIIAQTRQKQYPVITYRKYGKGHILLIAVPIIKSFCRGSRGVVFSKRAPLAAGGISELLLNAINRFSQDIYTGSHLTRLLPLELSLRNESSEEKTLKIKMLLPYGAEGFDYQPKPEEGEELKWTITIPAVSTETISYWLKLPNQINSFEIISELYEDETKLDEVLISFEVSQVVLYRLNELLLELESMDAVGKDAQLIRRAAHHLEKVRSRPGDSLMEDLLNLYDSVKAAAYLGDVRNIDVSTQRFNIQDIMVIMGRRFYETVKTWTENRLMPFLKMIEN